MNCHELTELLDNGDLRHLTGAEQREVDAHLSGCPDCAAEWRVQMRIATTPTPPAPPGFIETCRRLVAVGAARRFGGRLVVVGALVVLAAAAAVLGWYLQTPPPAPSPASAPAQAVTSGVVQPPAEVLPVVEPVPEPSPQAPKLQPVAPLPKIFTVAVWPLQSEGHGADAWDKAERFRQRVITLLQSVPNLVLIEKQPGEESTRADFELHMKLRDDGDANARIARIVELEFDSAAKIEAAQAAVSADAAMSPAERQRSQQMRKLAETLKQREAMHLNLDSIVALLLGMGAPKAAFIDGTLMQGGDGIEKSAQTVVRDLRINAFPLDESFEQQQLDVLSNTSQPDKARERALGALLVYAERRGGFTQMSPAAVRAGGEFALTWDTDIVLTRSMVWDGMALTRSPELVPYLIRGMNESPRTETRLHLVKILADIYGEDPRAKAALATAAKNNDQQTVRMAAMRETGGSEWSAYVGKTLMDTTLTDLQRLQPVADMAPDESGTSGTNPKSRLVLDDRQLREFTTLIFRTAPDIEATAVVQKALAAVGAMDTPAALDMLIKVVDGLHEDDVPQGVGRVAIMGARHRATGLIGTRYRGNPRARAVIEEQARSGNPAEKDLAQARLWLMETNATTDQNRQQQQAAPQSEK